MSDILWFINDETILDENSRDKNYFDISLELENFINKFYNFKKWSLVWLVWPFWVWKSTFLNQVRSGLSEDYWFEFDAWKYPDRSDLWENFVLELTRSMDKRLFDKTLSIIDWKQNEDKVAFLNMLVELPWDRVPIFKSIKTWINHFLSTSPAKRTFQIQELLTSIINNIPEQNIYLIIEDIDRSWDNWIYFIETLNYFLKNIISDKSIKVIIPISDNSYYDKLDSYMKCIDYFDFYNIKIKSFYNYFSQIFNKSLFQEHEIYLLASFIESIMKRKPNINIRVMKHVLRKSNNKYKTIINRWKSPNILIIIMIEVSKYFYLESEKKSLFDALINQQTVTIPDEFKSLALAIFWNQKWNIKKNSILVSRWQNQFISQDWSNPINLILNDEQVSSYLIEIKDNKSFYINRDYLQ